LSCASEKLEVGYLSKHTCTGLVGAGVRGLQKSFHHHPEVGRRGWEMDCKVEGGVELFSALCQRNDGFPGDLGR